LFASQYGWTVEQFLDAPPSVIHLLYGKIAKRKRDTIYEQLSIVVLAIRAALIRTLLPKTKEQQRSWRSFASEFANICRLLLLKERQQRQKAKALSTEDLVSMGFKKAD